jgi:putative tryptophan/tyrosine transport system substrate-binding protein
VFKVITQERADALIVSDQSEHGTYSRLIIKLAEESRLPALFPFRYFAEQGGLIAYGINTVDYYRRAAGYIARIFQGAKPSELPIDQATKIELVINLRCALSSTTRATGPPLHAGERVSCTAMVVQRKLKLFA